MSYVLTSTSDAQGKLHLEIPVSQPGTEFEVEVSVRPKAVLNGTAKPVVNPFSNMDAIRKKLAESGLVFSDSVELIREDRDR